MNRCPHMTTHKDAQTHTSGCVVVVLYVLIMLMTESLKKFGTGHIFRRNFKSVHSLKFAVKVFEIVKILK